jgi:hypothetical protein
MKRHLSFVLVALALSSLLGCSSTGGTDSMKSSLAAEPGISALAEKTGVTPDQAVGGLGLILAMAKNKLPADQFSQLTSGIPSADKYIQSLGGFGVDSGSVKDVVDLRGALQKVGMSEEVATRFMPEAVNMIRSSGGEPAAGILASLGL